jgi:CHAT domain-containing protein
MWRVADRPTAEFMQVFYHHLQRGTPRDEALRRAKLRLAQSGTALADPHYWAAFAMTGEVLRPVPRAVSWTTVAVAAAIPALALAFAARAVRRRRAPAVAMNS